MSRIWLVSSLGIALATGIVFAAYPQLDLDVAAWFLDRNAIDFPLARNCAWKVIRRDANWVPYIVLVPVGFVFLRKILYPRLPMLVAPSIVIFLLTSFLLGPGLNNVMLKEVWGRPRPHQVYALGGTESFEPWWRLGGSCEKNCSFVSGEASQAFWLVAPASLAPPRIRPFAIGGAVIFGTSVGALRVAFGRHFLTDVVFAGVLTIVIVFLLYRLLLAPARRNDSKLERALEQAALRLHRSLGRWRSTWQTLHGA